MTALQKITWAEIKASPGRFWLTVVAVALSTALLLAVFLGSATGMDAMTRFVMGQNGHWHWSADQLPGSLAQELTEDAHFTQWGVLGGKRSAATAQGGTSLNLYGTSGQLLEMMQTELLAGSIPQTPQEILVEDTFAQLCHLAVGDSLQIVGADGSQQTLQICGVFSHSVLNLQLSSDQASFNAFYGIDWNALQGENLYRFFSAADQLNQDYYNYIGSVEQRILSACPTAYPFYQTTLITLSGAPGPDGSSPLLLGINLLRGALLALIALASGMMIINSFSISLAERRRTLGMLVSVGATMRQAASCLLYEALFVAGVGIPAGLAIGCGGLGLAFWLLSPLLGRMKQLLGMDLTLRLILHPSYFILTALLSLAVVLFSAWLPARSFASGSIMQAIRGEKETKISSRITKTGKLAQRLGGPAAALAVKSAKRNRRRYASTVRSLALCIALLIASAGLAQYSIAVFRQTNQIVDAPLAAEYAVTGQDLTQTPLYQTLTHPQTPVDSISISETVFLNDLSIPIERYTAQAAALTEGLQTAVAGESFLTYVELRTLPDQEFQRLAGQAPADGQAVPCVLVNRYFCQKQSVVQTHYRPGDTLQATLEGVPVALQIAAVDERIYVQSRPDYAASLLMLTSQSNLNQLMDLLQKQTGAMPNRRIQLEYATPYAQDLKDELEPLQYGNAATEQDFFAVSDQRSEFTLSTIGQVLVYVILYGFFGVIGLIGASHVITTISAGLTLQQREFCMLRSLGMTSKELRHLILIQSIVHSLDGLLWGIPLGFALLWLEYRVLRQMAGFLFTVPWPALLLTTASVCFIALIAAAPHLRWLNKQNNLPRPL